jgi:Spy/CpxP family protein refolding chaperone
MRRTMKILTLVTGLALTGGLFAAGEEQKQDRRADRSERGGPDVATQVIEHLGKAIRRLDLNEQQKLDIREEFGNFKEMVRPLVKDLHEGRSTLRDAIISDSYDPDLVEDIAASQGNLTAEITIMVGESASTILSHLTDEQRAELMAMADVRREERKEMRELKREQVNTRRNSRSMEGSEES